MAINTFFGQTYTAAQLEEKKITHSKKYKILIQF